LADKVAIHYASGRNLARVIADSFRAAGKTPGELTPRDLARNQVTNLKERRIRTVSFICAA
jgi:glutamine synthetase